MTPKPSALTQSPLSQVGRTSLVDSAIEAIRFQVESGAWKVGERVPKEAELADMLAPHLRHDSRVVDVGCATGGLLSALHQRGFYHLMGLDPSPACVEVTSRIHGIEARAMTIHGLKTLKERFDVAMLTGVFEHLPELDESISSLIKILNPGGMLFIGVPDASSYYQEFSAPYQFLSMEHVNFFSPISLSNLMARRGFECLFTRKMIAWNGPRSPEPTVISLFSLTGKTAPPQFDRHTEPHLKQYLERSRQLEEKIHEKISHLVDSQVPLAVWGAGTHTLRLLETSRLASAPIVTFIDSNPRYKGKQLRGVPIITPEEFKSPEATVLISSQVAELEIKAQIQNQLGWTTPVVCLYQKSAAR